MLGKARIVMVVVEWAVGGHTVLTVVQVFRIKEGRDVELQMLIQMLMDLPTRN